MGVYLDTSGILVNDGRGGGGIDHVNRTGMEGAGKEGK